MAHNSNENNKTAEIKQNFLASAITDISTYIQLADTKQKLTEYAEVMELTADEEIHRLFLGQQQLKQQKELDEKK